ncbi:MAG: isoprenylcysteine carboxylmethyltransferase family protein [Rhodospirillaceae bacterium]
MIAGFLLYGLAWLSFGAGHSLLAGVRGRDWLVRRFGRAHRLVFNAIATVHILAVAGVGWALLGDSPPFALPEPMTWAMHGLAGAGVVAFVLFLRSYDSGRLLGTAQMRGWGDDDDEPLRLSGPHRWVRHPLYVAGFMILWGRAHDPFGLATALWGSAYLIVGTVFEERKLLARFGAAYAEYRRTVPMFLPRWPGRR